VKVRDIRNPISRYVSPDGAPANGRAFNGETDLARTVETKTSLSEQILHVQEEERKRISRELHDELGQSLMAISMNLEMLKRTAAAENETLKTQFADIHNLVQQTMNTVHRFARELRPAMLEELGLIPTLRSYLRDFAARTGLSVNFRSDPSAEALDRDQKIVVFRVAQESLTNIAKHAQASQVDFSICQIDGLICLKVADDGKSFADDQTESARKKGRLGLVGMEERVGLVGGTFSIEPQPGKGTTVYVTIPFKTGAVPRRYGNRRLVENDSYACTAQSFQGAML
jgi:signal transduction histidine kinase